MSFLQSIEWEQFQQSLGRKTWRVDGALVIKHELPYGFTPLEIYSALNRGLIRTSPSLSMSQGISHSAALTGFNYLYSPRPKLVTSNWLFGVEKIAKEEKSIFLKIDPAEELRISNHEVRIKESIPVQPRKTTILDLTKSEDELLVAMHGKTRYNIRLAERRGVQVNNFQFSRLRAPSAEVATKAEQGLGGQTIFNFQKFWELLRETATRDGFRPHERNYYEKLLQIKSENFSNELFFAEYREKVTAAALVNFYRSPTSIVATYLHGASSRERREIMAPHLLHRWITQEAKKRGFTRYDLWGIDEKKWPGLTRFKLGFGGTMIEYPQTVDVIYRNHLYALYRIIKSHKF